jgi:hypothetical protein
MQESFLLFVLMFALLSLLIYSAHRYSRAQYPSSPNPVRGLLPAVVSAAPEHEESDDPDDPRSATLAALERLPSTVELSTSSDHRTIPLIFDGQHWHHFDRQQGQHWGIFGATQSGKGNALQVIALLSLMAGPEHAHVWVFDPKGGLDYGFCSHLAHTCLYADEMDDVDGTLTAGYTAALAEMRRRNRLIRQAGARNYREYNADNTPLPTLILIADEVADLDRTQRGMLQTLARMGAASGIILCAATQYPTTDVLSGQVQANLHHRLVLRLASPRHTAVAIGLGAGEKSRYDPAAIPEPGVGVLRCHGTEFLGRIPAVTDDVRHTLITRLQACWPRTAVACNDENSTSTAYESDLQGAQQTGTVPVPETGTAGLPQSHPVEIAPPSEEAVLVLMMEREMSQNAICQFLGGNKQHAIERIKALAVQHGFQKYLQ